MHIASAESTRGVQLDHVTTTCCGLGCRSDVRTVTEKMADRLKKKSQPQWGEASALRAANFDVDPPVRL